MASIPNKTKRFYSLPNGKEWGGINTDLIRKAIPNQAESTKAKFKRE